MAKRGRNRKSNVKREPNGRPVRASAQSAEQEAMRTAIEYRQRVFGVSPQDVRDQKAATLLGRLCLAGIVSNAQWQAGEDWLKLSNALQAMVQAPRGFKTPSTSGQVLDDDELARRYRLAKERFDLANDAIEDHAPVQERKARFLALATIVVQEVDNEKMYGSLRTALNGLVRHFGLEGRKAA